ncbi:MAG: RNase adapter RapZ [Pseudomonadota bacterium]
MSGETLARQMTIIISGMSGSGKTTALRALEDTGFFCVDNLPVALLPSFLDLRRHADAEPGKTALGMDIREAGFITRFPALFRELRQQGYLIELLYLESSDEVLARRFSQTRRQHPFGEGESVPKALERERATLKPLRELAARVIDSSNFSVHQLREYVVNLYAKGQGPGMTVHILSFGFKYGLPYEADLVADVRFLPNPYFDPALKDLDGLNAKVINYVMDCEDTRVFLERFKGMLDFLLPRYTKEGKRHLTVAIGCTGGRHRSVVVAGRLADSLEARNGHVKLTHRDVNLA